MINGTPLFEEGMEVLTDIRGGAFKRVRITAVSTTEPCQSGVCYKTTPLIMGGGWIDEAWLFLDPDEGG